MKKSSNKGFTLVELIIVIAILAIIMLIAIPNFSGIQQRMQVRADKSTAAQIGKAVRIWYTEYGSDPSFKTTVDTAAGLVTGSTATKAAATEKPASLTTDITHEIVPAYDADDADKTMVHLCAVPNLISYVDTTLVPSSLIDATTKAKVANQYYFVGITGTGTGEKIFVAIDGTAPTLESTKLTQADVLYDGDIATTETALKYRVAYLEP